MQETRRQWEALTEPTRRVAVAADIELRRRHPDMNLEPLKSAEPPGIVLRRRISVPGTRPGVRRRWMTRRAVLPRQADRPEARNGRLLAEQREAASQEALGLTPETVHEEIPEQVLRIRENVRLAQARIDDLRNTRVPSEDHEGEDLGRAWDVLARRDRDAIVQPPKPDVVPAREILQRARDRIAEQEAEPA